MNDVAGYIDEPIVANKRPDPTNGDYSYKHKREDLASPGMQPLQGFNNILNHGCKCRLCQ